MLKLSSLTLVHAKGLPRLCGTVAEQVGFRMASFDEDRDVAYFHVGAAQYVV